MKPSQEAHKLVKMREGLVLKVYKDSLGKLTAGYGHLIQPGEPTSGPIAQSQADKWFLSDIKSAEDAALEQFQALPKKTQVLLDTLVSVNFQLGTQWFKKFPKTYSLMLNGDYDKAAFEVEDSLWAKQTPVRVRDFQRALWLSL